MVHQTRVPPVKGYATVGILALVLSIAGILTMAGLAFIKSRQNMREEAPESIYGGWVSKNTMSHDLLHFITENHPRDQVFVDPASNQTFWKCYGPSAQCSQAGGVAVNGISTVSCLFLGMGESISKPFFTPKSVRAPYLSFGEKYASLNYPANICQYMRRLPIFGRVLSTFSATAAAPHDASGGSYVPTYACGANATTAQCNLAQCFVYAQNGAVVHRAEHWRQGYHAVCACPVRKGAVSITGPVDAQTGQCVPGWQKRYDVCATKVPLDSSAAFKVVVGSPREISDVLSAHLGAKSDLRVC